MLILCIVFIAKMNLMGQGLNNKYPIDSVDIKNIIQLLGIEAFKYPLQKMDDTLKIRIVFEMYENNKRIKKTVLTSGLEDYYLKLTKESQILRIYKQEINDSTVQFNINMDGFSLSKRAEFEKDDIGRQQCRGYSEFQPEKGKSVPIFIWSAFKKDRIEPMHCPGNAPLSKAAEIFDFVIGISLEVEAVEKK